VIETLCLERVLDRSKRARHDGDSGTLVDRDNQLRIGIVNLPPGQIVVVGGKLTAHVFIPLEGGVQAENLCVRLRLPPKYSEAINLEVKGHRFFL